MTQEQNNPSGGNQSAEQLRSITEKLLAGEMPRLLHEPVKADKHGVKVEHTQDNRGMTTSRCPRCETMFAYWDEDDLDENGDLICYCEK